MSLNSYITVVQANMKHRREHRDTTTPSKKEKKRKKKKHRNGEGQTWRSLTLINERGFLLASLYMPGSTLTQTGASLFRVPSFLPPCLLVCSFFPPSIIFLLRRQGVRLKHGTWRVQRKWCVADDFFWNVTFRCPCLSCRSSRATQRRQSANFFGICVFFHETNTMLCYTRTREKYKTPLTSVRLSPSLLHDDRVSVREKYLISSNKKFFFYFLRIGRFGFQGYWFFVIAVLRTEAFLACFGIPHVTHVCVWTSLVDVTWV